MIVTEKLRALKNRHGRLLKNFTAGSINEFRKLEFLIELKEHPDWTNRELQKKIKVVSHVTIGSWKRKYKEGGYYMLMKETIRKPMLTTNVKIETINLLKSADERSSFKAIHRIINKKYPDVSYDNLLKYIKKEHINFYREFVKNKLEFNLQKTKKSKR